MKSSKLIRIIRGLSKNEFRKFGDFIRSPYYNKNDKLTKLYDFLKDSNGEFEFVNITKESLAEFVFPEIQYNEQKIRTLVSDFIKMVEKFLVVIEEEKNPVFQKVYLVRALIDRNITGSFNTVLKETLDAQNKEFNRDEDYYYNQMYLELESLNYKVERDESVQRTDYNKITSNIDLFFIITKLSMLHFISHHEKNIKPDNDINEWLIEEIIQYIKENLILIKKEHPIIYMKYLVLMSIIHPDDARYYKSLKNYSITNWKKFNTYNRGYVFGSLKNYVIDKYNKGNMEFKKERFYIDKFIEDKNILDYENFISHTDFLNSISSALAVKNVKWAESFFKKYKDKILPDLKEDAMNLALAQILYFKKDFEQANIYLNEISYRKYYFYLRSKMIIAQMLYESSQYEPAGYLIDAVRHYLNRKKEKMPVSEYNLFRNFFHLLGRLLNISKADVRMFKQELKNQSNVANKEWLLRKATEFNKRK